MLADKGLPVCSVNELNWLKKKKKKDTIKNKF